MATGGDHNRNAAEYGLTRLIAPRNTSTATASSHFVLGTDTSSPHPAFQTTMSADYVPLQPPQRGIHGPSHRSTDHAHGDRSKVNGLVSVTELSYKPHSSYARTVVGSGNETALRSTHFQMHSDARFASFETTNSQYYAPIDLSARDHRASNLHASSIPQGDREKCGAQGTTSRDAFTGHPGAAPTVHAQRPADARGVTDSRFGVSDRFITSSVSAFGDVATAVEAARSRRAPLAPRRDTGVVHGDAERFGIQVSVTEDSFRPPAGGLQMAQPADHLRRSHVRLTANRHDWPLSTANEAYAAPAAHVTEFVHRPFNESFVPTGDVRATAVSATTANSSYGAPEGHVRTHPIDRRSDGIVFGRPSEGAAYETTAQTSFGAYAGARPDRTRTHRKTAIAYGELDGSHNSTTTASDFRRPIGGRRPPLGDGNMDRLCGTHFDFGRDTHFKYYSTTTADAFTPYGHVERVQPVNPALQTHSHSHQ